MQNNQESKHYFELYMQLFSTSAAQTLFIFSYYCAIHSLLTIHNIT